MDGITINIFAATAEATEKLQNFFDGVNKTVAEINKLGTAEIKKAGDAITKTFSSAGAAVQDSTAVVTENVVKVGKIGSAEIGKVSEGIVGNFNKVNNEAQKSSAGIVSSFSQILKVGEFATGVGAAIAAAFTLDAIFSKVKEGIASVIDGIHRAINAADDMGSLKSRTGIALETLNGLNKLAGQSKLSYEGMALGLTQFNDRLFNAIRLGGEAARPFREMQVSIRDVNGEMRNSELVFKDLWDRFSQMEDGPEKINLAMDVFGRGASLWIPLLNKGSQALDEFKDKQGNVTTAMAANAEAFNKAWSSVKGTLKSVYTQVAAEILPSLKEFAEWLKAVISETTVVKDAVNILVFVFRELATYMLTAKTALVALIEVFQGFNQIASGLLVSTIILVRDTFNAWWQAILNTIRALIDLGKTSTAVGGILADVAQGNFKKAWKNAQGTLNEVKEDIVSIGKGASTALTSTASSFASFVLTNLRNTRSAVSETFNQLLDQAGTFWRALQTINGNRRRSSDAPGGNDKAGNDKSDSGAKESAEAQRILDEIQKQYYEATRSRLELLEIEQEEKVKKLQEEVADYETYLDAVLQLDVIYDAKRRQIREQQDDEKLQFILEKLKQAQDRVASNPDLDAAEIKKQLLPLLQKENELLKDNIKLQEDRQKDPGLNEDQQLEAERKKLQLMREQANVQRQIKALESTNFLGTFQAGLNRLSDTWSNFGQNFANVAINGIERAVNGIGDAIMGVIDGTRTWGQVFAQIGSNIIASIIQIMVQWIASMTIIKALKAIFRTTDTADATQSAAAWAPAAIAASIASYGAAAAIGTSAYLAGLFSGTAITAGLSVAGYERGGIISGGEQLIRVNEGNKIEAVLNNRAVRNLGTDLINNINAGLVTASTLAENIPASITQPITAGNGVPGEAIAGRGVGARGFGGFAGGQSVNVQPPGVTVAVINRKQELLEFIQRDPKFRKAVLNLVGKRRVDAGIRT